MSTDRGQRRAGRSGKKLREPKGRPGALKLAPGVRLGRDRARQGAAVLVCRSGNVQLNRGAVAIIRLCDGSRRREDIIAEVLKRSDGATLASDVSEFLEVALACGWIVEV